MIINFNETTSARLQVQQQSNKIRQLIHWLQAIEQARDQGWSPDICVDIFLDHQDISIHINEERFKNKVRELYKQIPEAEPLD